MPTYGEILNRKNSEVLVDIGQKDGLVADSTTEWLIVKKDSIKTADTGIGISFLDSDVLGYYAVEKIGEEMSSGIISQKGFYDKINVGDFIVPVDVVTPTEEETETSTESTAENVEPAGKSPVLLDLLRNIKN